MYGSTEIMCSQHSITWEGPLSQVTVGWIQWQINSKAVCKYFKKDVQFANKELGSRGCNVLGTADNDGYCTNCYSTWRHHTNGGKVDGKDYCGSELCDCESALPCPISC